MKKTLAIILTAIMVLSISITAFAIAELDEDGNIIENESLPGGIMTLSEDIPPYFILPPLPAFRSITGEVIEFWENDYSELIRIRINGEEENFADFSMHINTYVVGEAPQIGDTITGFYYVIPITMIYPPQYTTVALINRTDDFPRIIIDRFGDDWISSANEYRLNISDDTEITYQNGDPFTGEREELIGRILMVEFMISHRDIPETIPNPQRITILYERAVHPIINIDIGEVQSDIWQNIEWSGNAAADLDSYDIIIAINGLPQGVPNANLATVGESAFPNYIPLRAVVEMLGFTPWWNEERREIAVGSPQGEITMRVDFSDYTLISNGITSAFTLDPPVIINGRTYVPVSFFREIYGFTNAWWEGGHVYLDNDEVMN